MRVVACTRAVVWYLAAFAASAGDCEYGGSGPRTAPARCVEKAFASLCALWPRPGSAGCAGLLHAPLAQDAKTRRVLAEKARAAVARGRLTIVAMGDSITAGHDNFYNQSWVPQLEVLLGPFLERLGVKLVVENFAVGNIGEYPFAAGCMAARIGDLAESADILTWNWAMYGDPPCAMEQFLVDAYALPSRPVVLGIRDTRVPLSRCLDVDSGPCGALKRAYGREWWSAGTRPWRENAFFLSEAFAPPEDVAVFAEHAFDGRAPDDGRGRAALVAAAAAAGLDADPTFGLADLSPAAVAENFDDNATVGWWAARAMAVNFLWHPGPVGHTLIASQVAAWVLDALRHPPPARARRDAARPRHLALRAACGRSSSLCATLLRPSRGAAPLTEYARPSRWALLEDFIEHDYRAFWRGGTPGWADGLDSKVALYGDADAGPIEFVVPGVPGGASILLCEHRCGTSGCEKHRGWLSFGTKAGYGATVTGRTAVLESITGRRPASDIFELLCLGSNRTRFP